jgi:bifunctional non-homologous end joining protein LigD
LFAVMLAHSAPAEDSTITRLINEGGWVFDLKIDGIRCVAAINSGKVTLTNRNSVDITYRYPEICEALLKKFGTDAKLVLDGEVVVFHEGKPSFKHTSKRDRQQKPAVIKSLSETMPATMVVFDLLYADADLRTMPYEERKLRLDATLNIGDNHPRVQPNVSSPDGHKMLSLVREHGLEGLVAKRLNSRYQAGRRSDWLKIKPTQTVSCIVVGATQGTGARGSTFGALSLELIKNGERVSVGEVGTGFKQVDLQEILDTYIHFRSTSGFATNVPQIHTPFVVEVEFQEMTVDGKLRFPVFRGIRTDVEIDTCYYEQVQQHQIEELTL